MPMQSELRLHMNVPHDSIAIALQRQARSFGSKTSLIDATSEASYSFSDVHEIARKIGQALFYEYGLRKGDVILLISPNCAEYVLVMLGALTIGVIPSTANPSYTVGEMEVHLKDSGAKYVFTAPELSANVLRAASSSANQAQGVFVFGEAAHCLSYASLLRYTGSQLPPVFIDNKRDVALLPYSSGTTGTPKGVMLTHHNLLTCMLQVLHPKFNMYSSSVDNRMLMFLPMYHSFGLILLLTSLFHGVTVISMRKYEMTLFIEHIRNYQVTLLPLVPPVLLQLVKAPSVTPTDLRSVRSIFYGGAPVGAELEDEWDEKFPGIHRMQGYGLTETAPGVLLAPIGGSARVPNGSVGILLPAMESRIVNLQTGADCAVGEEGELWCRGDNIMKGYYGRPEATRHCIDEHGWFHTGDVARVDKDGFYFIVDRIKELIKYKGNQVAPAELEGVLLGHAAVADCAVVGVPDQQAGELPRAYVVLKPGQRTTEQQIQKYMAELTAPYKKLRGGVRFVDAIPKSPSGKILRRVIKEQIRAEMKPKAKL